MDNMEFQRFGIQEDDDEDDAATQYMIEQSLLESSKQKETHKDSTTRDSRRLVVQSTVSLSEKEMTEDLLLPFSSVTAHNPADVLAFVLLCCLSKYSETNV